MLRSKTAQTMKKALILSVSILAASCSDMTSTAYKTVFTNTSGKKVEVRPYKNGVVTEDAFTLENGAEASVASGSYRGQGQGFAYLEPRGFDSVVVVFGDDARMPHYNTNITGGSPKSYPKTSPRSLLNRANYAIALDEGRRKNVAFYSYSFTPQDYLDASK